MVTPEQAAAELLRIQARINSGEEIPEPELLDMLGRLTMIREEMNERRREAEGSIRLAQQDLNDAIADEQRERLP